jgi:ribonuclease HII
MAPSFEYEDILVSNGFKRIAGVDEAGRGCIAGPLVAAAVILPADRELPWIKLLNDSKKLTEKQRDALFPEITAHCEYGTCLIDAYTIDVKGMSFCGREVLENAVKDIAPLPDSVLVDHFKLPTLNLPQIDITHGDALSLSIAAASIVAKVTRDRIMEEMDKEYPNWQFAKHKGYGTALHAKLIKQYGLSPIHRKSFCTNFI